MRRFATALLVTSALNLAFYQPSYAAAPETKVEKAEDQVVEANKANLATLAKLNGKFEFYDAKGVRVEPGQIASSVDSLRDGFSVGSGPERLNIKGEMDANKTDLVLNITYLVNGQPLNGQVMTIKPGMTKAEIENRFQDMIASFSQSAVAAQKTKTGTRAVAAEFPTKCIVLIAGLVTIASFLAVISPSRDDHRASKGLRGLAVWGLVTTFVIALPSAVIYKACK